MSIYTKTGDEGFTYFGKKRIRKDSIELEFLGKMDELRSLVELLYNLVKNKEIREDLDRISKFLMKIASYICCNIKDFDIDEEVKFLENRIEEYWNFCGSINKFILRFESLNANLANYVRTKVREVERMFWNLYFNKFIENKSIGTYFNRLSDYFFSLSRYINKKEGKKEYYF